MIELELRTFRVSIPARLPWLIAAQRQTGRLDYWEASFDGPCVRGEIAERRRGGRVTPKRRWRDTEPNRMQSPEECLMGVSTDGRWWPLSAQARLDHRLP